MRTKTQCLEVIASVLASDCGCDPGDLVANDVKIVKARLMPNRRKFQVRDKQLLIVSMGNGAVVSCDDSRLTWANKALGSLLRDEIFEASMLAHIDEIVREDGQMLAGPDLKYCCSQDTLQLFDYSLSAGYDLRVVEQSEISSLYEYDGFGMALSYQDEGERPDVLAVVATYSNRVVGIAGATADNDIMWQVGVHIDENFHHKGIGTALVSEITHEILNRGKVPYYSTTVANLASRSLALKVGYWPAWVEMYSC